MRIPVALTLAVLVAPGVAAAQHDHAHHGHHGQHGAPGAHAEEAEPGSSFGASLGVIAAGYESMLYTGDYQGLVATARWSRGRFSASAGITGYRLERNGQTLEGVGDLMVHGHAMLVAAGPVTAGAMAMVMAPTGDHEAGLGMGHVMVMPGGWIQWAPGRLALGTWAGYARGLGDDGIHAEHGSWPLVDPMNFSELAFGATATLALARPLRAGLRLDGAVPLGDGDTRLTTGVRATWTRGRLETTAELQAGLVGAPFDVRGLVEAGVRFD